MTMPAIGVIDYGCGNIRSVCEAFGYLDCETRIVDTAASASSVSHLVLPGVGAFPNAMEKLERSGLAGAIDAHIKAGKPFLGICLGMQLLMKEGREFGVSRGLSIFKGDQVSLTDAGLSHLPCPHTGWAQIRFERSSRLYDERIDGEYFYFNHSYVCSLENRNDVAAVSDDTVAWTVAIERDNVLGVQCHPEKSHLAGLRLLGAFTKLS